MGLWPSRGLHLTGFEIKAGRGDWLRELRDPRKAEEIAAFCDQWWVVAPADVILPRRHRAVATQASLAGIGDVAEDLSLAAVLRRAAEHVVPKSLIEAELRAAYERGLETGVERVRQDRRWQAEEDQRLRDAVAEFEAVSGVKIDRYRGARIGEAVSLMMRWQQERDLLTSRVEGLRADLADLVQHMDRILASGTLCGLGEGPPSLSRSPSG